MKLNILDPKNERVLKVTRRLIYRVLYCVDFLTGRKNNLFVLCYHNITGEKGRFNVPLDEFKRQITMLSKTHRHISANDLEDVVNSDGNIKEPSFLLTFDDGFKGILDTREFLAALKIRPVIFVLSKPENADRLQLGSNDELLSDSEVLQLISDGWVLGSHGRIHRDYFSSSDEEIRADIVLSKDELEEKFGINTPYFAYPKGRYTQTIINYVKSAGYRLAFSMDDTFVGGNIGAFSLPRVGVDSTHSLGEVRASFSPSVVSFRRAVKESKVLGF